MIVSSSQELLFSLTAPFLLTLLLLELLLQSPDSRVINVSAHTHVFGSIHKDDLLLSAPGAYSAFKAYAQSKLALILFTRELASQYQGMFNERA